MKTKRNLSGVYVRFKNPETDKYENRCFEDLPHIDQIGLLAGKETSWIISLATTLADTLNEIGEQFDVVKE